MAKDLTLFNRFLVDDHNTIRNYFRYTFLASCYTVDDYERYYGIGKSKINNWLIPKLKKTLVQNGEEMNPRKRGGHGKFVWDPNPGWFQDGGTLIWKTFKFRTATVSQVLSYFLVLSELQNDADRAGIREELISDKISFKFDDWDGCSNEHYTEKQRKTYKMLTYFKANSRTKELLNEMKTNGIIGTKNQKRILPDNPLDHLDEPQQRWLYYLSQFYAKVVPYSAAGYYWMDTLLEYQKEAKTDYALQWPDVFCFQNDYFYQMLDDDVLLKLHTAWKEEKLVELTYQKGKRYNNRGNSEEGLWYETTVYDKQTLTLFPLRVLPPDLYGRRNVLVYVIGDRIKPEARRYNLQVLRLDRIENVKLLKPVVFDENCMSKESENQRTLKDDEYNTSNFSCRTYKHRFPDIFQFSWNNSLSGKKSNYWKKRNWAEPQPMVIEFDFTNYPSREKQLILEKKHGTLEQTAPHCYRLEILLTDQKEILPWIYSFGGAAKVVQCTESTRKHDFSQKPAEVLKNYGIF